MLKKQKILSNLAQALFLIIFFSACLISGLIIGHFADVIADGSFAVIIIGFVMYLAAVYLQIAIHEFGHMVFGLLTGYKFRSIRFGSFMWVKLGGKIKFKRYSLPGTGGQCLMGPPDIADGKMPFAIYNLGGCFLNLISAALFFALCPISPNTYFGLFCTVMGIWGIATALQNGIPFYLPSISNDGSNTLAIAKNKTALRAFWLTMKINEALTDNVRIGELPAEWFELEKDDDISNHLASSLLISRCDRFIDLHRFTEARDELKRILDDGKVAVPGLLRNLLINNLISCILLVGGDPSEYESYKTKEYTKMSKALATNISMIRTNYICALLADNDSAAAEKALDAFRKLEKTYPYPCDYQTESELIEAARMIKENR